MRKLKKCFLLVALALMSLALCACCITHEFSAATCTAPATCSKCGETEGEALGHDWLEATCIQAKTCQRCLGTQGEALGHKWNDATCTKPMICSVCGEESGKPLGHAWVEPTCTEKKTCSVCGKKEGKALGHSVVEWTVTTAPTCSEKGEEQGICAVCGETVSKSVEKLEHTPGDWVVTEMPTETKKGTHIMYCTVCEAQIKNEKFTLSDEELKELYKKNCQNISYDALSRTPDEYEGEYVKFSGVVLQVCSEASSSRYYSTYRVATSGSYNNVVLLYVDNYGSKNRILEDDKITFYGTSEGLYTYETVLGSSVTIPSILAEYVE